VSAIRLHWLLSLLLLLAAALFTIGVIAEHAGRDEHHEPAATVEDTEHSESEEHAEGSGAVSAEADHADESDEGELFGLNVESSPLVIAAVAASIVLAALTWRFNMRTLLLTTAVFAAGFTILDGAEVVHQFSEHRIGIAVLAIVITAVHLGAAVVAEQRVEPSWIGKWQASGRSIQ
jgi:hypothetical protein